jgi:hypothetical protein
MALPKALQPSPTIQQVFSGISSGGMSYAGTGGGGTQVSPTGQVTYFGGGGGVTYNAQPQSIDYEAQRKIEEQKRLEDERKKAELAAMLSPTKPRDIFGTGNLPKSNIKTGNVNLGNIKLNYSTQGRNLPAQRSSLSNISPTTATKNILLNEYAGKG